MNNKKKIIMGSIIGIMLGLLIGTTYAIFSYNKLGNNNQIVAGDIYMHYNESNTLTLENALPSNTYDPNNYFEFTIKGKNTNKKYNIVYDINLNYGDEIENKTRIQDRFLKFRLVEVINNEETELLTDKLYLSIDNKRIYVSTINKETNNEVTKTYRLYVWIDKSVVIGNTDYSDYSISDWNNIYGSVKVSVTGDFSEKELQTEPYLVMKNLNGIQDWKDIRASITSIEFHNDGIEPVNYITSFDVTDETSSGEVTLYTIDDGLGNNTYKAIVVGEDVIYAPVDSTGIFKNMSNLKTFNSKNFRVDYTINVQQIFSNNINLVNIESLSSWNTINITNMMVAFQNCKSLVTLDGLSNWNTSNVTYIYGMYGVFLSCENLTDISALANWNVSNVKNMSWMFRNCFNLVNIDALCNWNVSNVKNMDYMFASCNNLSDINSLSLWDTSNVTDMSYMFIECLNLTNIIAIKNWNVERLENASYMFRTCINLEQIDLSGWKTLSLTNIQYMFSMYYADGSNRLDSKLKNIFLSNTFDTSKVVNMSGLLANNTQIEDYSFLQYFNIVNVQNFYQIFRNNYKLVNLDVISDWDVSKSLNMSYMFQGCKLQDVSGINDWNININANFTYMFHGTSVHPEFTKVAGTWDSNGTFIPTV